MPRMKIRGASIEYVERGDGEPIVLVHGSLSDVRTWRVQLDDLSGRHRTIAYSRRYHWPNERIHDGADYNMDEHVDDLTALLRALDVVPSHLVAHSYGAFVALLLAIRSPDLVRTLVLAEPPAIRLFVSNQPTPKELLSLALRRPRTAVAILKFGLKGVAPAAAAARRDDVDAAVRSSGKAVLGPRFFSELSSSRLEQVRANFIKAELLGSGFAPLRDDDVRGVRAPALLMSAQHSPALFHRLLDRLEELLPRTDRVEIPAASHIMHEDNPRAYGDAVLTFLAACSGE